jgi:hypothetical protein
VMGFPASGQPVSMAFLLLMICWLYHHDSVIKSVCSNGEYREKLRLTQVVDLLEIHPTLCSPHLSYELIYSKTCHFQFTCF